MTIAIGFGTPPPRAVKLAVCGHFRGALRIVPSEKLTVKSVRHSVLTLSRLESEFIYGYVMKRSKAALSTITGIAWRCGIPSAKRRQRIVCIPGEQRAVRTAITIVNFRTGQRRWPIAAPLVNREHITYHVAMVGQDRSGTVTYAEPGAEEAARLMRAVANKDRRAFETLYYTYSPRLGRYLLRLLKRREVVDEVLNDVMLVVWQSADRYDPSLSRLSTWLFGIAHNKALKAFSTISRHQVEVSIDPIESDDFAEAADGSDAATRADPHNPEQTLIGRQVGHALQWAVESLSAEHRSVIELAFAEDCSYQEIATTLDCPVNTIKTRMFYARKHLAELMTRYEAGARTKVRSNLS